MTIEMESFIRQPTRGKRLSRAKTFTWLSGAHVGDWLLVVCRWKCVVFVVYSQSRDDFCQWPQGKPLKAPFHGRTDRRASRDEMPRRVTNEYADTCYSYSCRGSAFVSLQIFPGPTPSFFGPSQTRRQIYASMMTYGLAIGSTQNQLGILYMGDSNVFYPMQLWWGGMIWICSADSSKETKARRKEEGNCFCNIIIAIFIITFLFFLFIIIIIRMIIILALFHCM